MARDRERGHRLTVDGVAQFGVCSGVAAPQSYREDCLRCGVIDLYWYRCFCDHSYKN